ncbi:D-lactate dehydrogenase (cytochrome) [Sphingobium chlorophenolicum L-1]|uniref:D-lactate dehydrogenase (Cytochrome) n=1 Tax=Sphingobium chlorophenolicum L-1 TaxID=690566 RepID=F6F356_SPHCR|nr:FAD-binding oxidoreductase [Sphingobium chlorophenolicum]AEG50868.1 D-lactate dehydrogenase (cytochrome) [Sphingobium chlorophenolicum L-1]
MTVAPAVSAAAFESGLFAIVGPRGLIRPEEFGARSCDPFRQVPIQSRFLVRPSCTAEVAQVVRLCRAHGVPIITHGGATGVCGGAFTREDSIVVSLERMNAIAEISHADQLAVVEAGVPVEALQEAAAAQGLFYAVDLGSKGSATIGGTLATNAGGNHVLRWGMTRMNVLGIEAVLADGTIVSAMNRLIKNNSGYDLKHMLIGSEGTLGIITRAVMKLEPLPTTHEVAFVAVPTMDKVVSLLTLARAVPSLSAFEVMWDDYYRLVAESRAGRRPIEPGCAYHVLIETMGYDEQYDHERLARLIERASEDGLIADGVLASSERQRSDLWRVREASDVLVREFKELVSFDIGIPLTVLEAFVGDARTALTAAFPDMRMVTFGHLGDGNVHFGVSIGTGTIERTRDIEDVVFAVVAEYGGVLTAEHGVGQTKREFLPRHKDAGEMAMMRMVRNALDPDRILNPDVLF